MTDEIKRKPTVMAIAKREDIEDLVSGDVVFTSFRSDYVGKFFIYAGKENGKIEIMVQDPYNYRRIVSSKVNPDLFVFSGEEYSGDLRAISKIDKIEEVEFSKYTPKNAKYDEKARLFKLTGNWHGPKKKGGRYKYHVLINREGKEVLID